MDRYCLVCGEKPTSSYTYPVSMKEALKWQKMLNSYVPVTTLRHYSCVCNKHIYNSHTSSLDEMEKGSQYSGPSKPNDINERRLSVSFNNCDAIHYFGHNQFETATTSSDSTVCEAQLNRKLGCTQLKAASIPLLRTHSPTVSDFPSTASEENVKRSTSGLDKTTTASQDYSCGTSSSTSTRVDPDYMTSGSTCPNCQRACLGNCRMRRCPQFQLNRSCSSGISLKKGSERIPQQQSRRQQKQEPQIQQQWLRQYEPLEIQQQLQQQSQPQQNPQQRQQQEQPPQMQPQWQRQDGHQPIQQQWQKTLQQRQNQDQGCQCRPSTCNQVMQCQLQEQSFEPKKYPSDWDNYCELNSNTTLCSDFFVNKADQINGTAPKSVSSYNSAGTTTNRTAPKNVSSYNSAGISTSKTLSSHFYDFISARTNRTVPNTESPYKTADTKTNITPFRNIYDKTSAQTNRTDSKKGCPYKSADTTTKSVSKNPFEQPPINVLVMGGSMVPNYYNASDKRMSIVSEICVLESDLAHEGVKSLNVDVPTFTVCRAHAENGVKDQNVGEKESATDVLLVGKAPSVECTCSTFGCKDPSNSETKSPDPQPTLDCKELLKNQKERMQELEGLMNQQQILQQTIQSKLNELQSTPNDGRKPETPSITGNSIKKSPTMGNAKMK